MVQLTHAYIGKMISVTIWTIVGKVMSLLFNTLSRFVIALLPRRKYILISWLQSSSAVILEPKKIKSVTVSTFPLSICHEVMGPDVIILVFKCWVLSQLLYSLLFPSPSSYLVPLHFMLLESYHLYIWGYWYFSQQSQFQLESNSSMSFCMMYSAYKLNKQGDNIQPWCTSFPILNQSFVPYLVLTIASWPTSRSLRRLARWSGIPISLRNFHSLLWSTQSKVLAYSTKQNRWFSGIFLLLWWSSRCWQFDLWFLCLFEIQLVHLEGLSLCIAEA